MNKPLNPPQKRDEVIQLPDATLVFENYSSEWPEEQHFCPCPEQPSLWLWHRASGLLWPAWVTQEACGPPHTCQRVLDKIPQSFRETWKEQLSSRQELGTRMLIEIMKLLIILSMQKDVHDLAFQMIPCRSILIAQADKSGCGLSLPHSPLDRAGSASQICSMKCPEVGKGLPHHSPATDQHNSSQQLTG